MKPLIHEHPEAAAPEALARQVRGEGGLVCLRSATFESPQSRYSFVAARPFLTFRSFGARCELTAEGRTVVQFGNPWRVLDDLMARYELLEEPDLPFPLGGCFGYFGYDLKNFVEPKLSRRAVNDLEWPDCHVGFFDSLVAFDHLLGKTWIVSTGLQADGARNEKQAREQLDFWSHALEAGDRVTGRATQVGDWRLAIGDFASGESQGSVPGSAFRGLPSAFEQGSPLLTTGFTVGSNFTRPDFLAAVEQAQRYIRAGDIYQVNLSQRLAAPFGGSGWQLFERLLDVSPAPFAAYLDCGDFELASSSPELFLRLTGAHIRTRPIKGTRPRDADPTRDAQLTYELQTSPKEMAELVMITDLLRNDLGRVCEFGSVQVPELVRLERFAQVQHLVSTVEGHLRPDVSHLAALAACFPGGSVTGAPKFRAMEIIDELEPTVRGPYTGALGYLGFNRESQLSIIIRTAICREGRAWFPVGAGIVADSDPAAEYDETLAKARGFLAALESRADASQPTANESMNPAAKA
jgi:para-aminobenzoate synthetase component 1